MPATATRAALIRSWLRPQNFANDSLSPLIRAVVLSTRLLAFGLVVALWLPTQSGTALSEATKPLPVLTAENAVGLCRQLFGEPREYIDDGGADCAQTLGNAQFQDRPGACKLIETAVGRGDQSMAQRPADCRAN